MNTGFVLFIDLEDEFPSTAITSTFRPRRPATTPSTFPRACRVNMCSRRSGCGSER